MICRHGPDEKRNALAKGLCPTCLEAENAKLRKTLLCFAEHGGHHDLASHKDITDRAKQALGLKDGEL